MIIDCVKIDQYRKIGDEKWTDAPAMVDGIYYGESKNHETRPILRIVGVKIYSNDRETYTTLKEEVIKELSDSINACQCIKFMGIDYLYFPNFLGGQICLQSTRTTI